ncbi:MAG: hypothetical protein RRY22_02605 [Bacilli bacterium]
MGKIKNKINEIKSVELKYDKEYYEDIKYSSELEKKILEAQIKILNEHLKINNSVINKLKLLRLKFLYCSINENIKEYSGDIENLDEKIKKLKH